MVLGYGAGASMTSGTQHVLIGFNAGNAIPNQTDGSVCVGYEAGKDLTVGG